MLESRATTRLLTALVVLVATCSAIADVREGGAPAPERLAVSSVPATPVPVAQWDPSSPQRIVRLADRLYQQDAGFYYPVEEDRITVRLSDGIADWTDLLTRAQGGGSQSFSLLDQLTPMRRNRLGIIDLAIPGGTDPTDWCQLVFQTGLVRYAEVSTVGVYTVTPNDTRYDEQYALHNTGQSGGTIGADMDAEAAWQITAGDPSVVVAVLDSGTDIDHEDLAANVWHNDDETPNNSVDDDGNGFVDDWEGWDFANGNNNPRGSFYHGTHVTGCVNGVTNNGKGIAGLAGGFGSLGVKGMAVGVGDSGPVGSILDDSIIYAADNGAHVITMSLSVGSSSAINDALDYAYNTKDVFIDCAAGNNGSSVGYPANRPEVMAVASTDRNDNKSSFSNPGPQVEVAAPGSSILSTQLGNSYASSSGTSFAAPYVGALAGLIRSVSPGMPAAEVRQLIIDSAEDVEDPGFDNGTGWGRINAFQALSMTASSDGDIRFDTGLYSCDDLITVTVTDVDLAGAGTLGVTVTSGIEPVGETVVLIETGSNTGAFRGTLATAAGAPAADGVLQIAHADAIAAEYLDADDGAGNINVPKVVNAGTDCAGPLISEVSVASVDDDSAVITWVTDESGSSRILYGEVPPPSQSATSGGSSSIHSVNLNGLQSCTVYRFQVESEDGLGNLGIDDNAGGYYSFETYGNFPGVGITPCHQGQAALDRSVYGCDETVIVSVTDVDLNVDAGAAESIQVLVTSTSEPEGEWITLTEISDESSRFEGPIALGAPEGAADGELSGKQGDLVTVTYYDNDDGNGAARVSTASAVIDCLPPKIQNVRVSWTTATRATIEWDTDEPATSRLEYGATSGLGSAVEDGVLKTSHGFEISAFEACDRVYFRVSGTDTHGELRVADAGGAPFQFNLQQIGGVVFHDNFEAPDGWSLAQEWERGAPQGLGSSSKDPENALSGNSVLGTDLSGQGAFSGDYEPSLKQWAISPAFDTTGTTDLELIFQRKLGVTSSDDAAIHVFSDGSHEIWSNTDSVADGDWVEVRYDVSDAAAGHAAVRLGFRIESTDPGQSFGWNLDEVIVKDSTHPDYLACGGCIGGPTFRGVDSVVDGAPCGASGLTLAWEPAGAWGSGTGGTYDVHRGTTPGFVPDAGNRVATGLTSTTWTDTGAPPDSEVWYVVRARNNESCTGGEGLADANTVRLSATETVARPVPGPLGESVLARRVGGAHVRLAWDAVPDADVYVVRRSQAPEFTDALEVGTTSEIYFEDPDVASDPNLYFYRIFPANDCGQEAP